MLEITFFGQGYGNYELFLPSASNLNYGVLMLWSKILYLTITYLPWVDPFEDTAASKTKGRLATKRCAWGSED